MGVIKGDEVIKKNKERKATIYTIIIIISVKYGGNKISKLKI